MGVPTSEVSYTSATTGRGDHKFHKGHVVALEIKVWVAKVIRTGTFKKLDNLNRLTT
jgi:hypothetical protein